MADYPEWLVKSPNWKATQSGSICIPTDKATPEEKAWLDGRGQSEVLYHGSSTFNQMVYYAQGDLLKAVAEHKLGHPIENMRYINMEIAAEFAREQGG